MGLYSTVLLMVALLVTVAVVVGAVLNPALCRLGLRNVGRRKWNTALVVVGSMVGTALISGSLVLNDSTARFQYEEARETLGEIDEVVQRTGQRLPSDRRPLPAFDESVVERLSPEDIREEIENSGEPEEGISGELRRALSLAEEEPAEVDGVIGVLNGEAPAESLDEEGETIIASPAVTVVGADWGELGAFGEMPPSVVELPAPREGEVYVSERLSEALEIGEGSRLRLVGFSGPEELEVAGVLPEEGVSGYRARFSSSEGTVLVEPGMARGLFGAEEGEVNAVFVSNGGDEAGGVETSEEVAGALRGLLEDEGEPPFQVLEAKKDTLEGGGIRIGDIFLMISSFAILAGMLLIVNIYAMLAEERKGELGILRAVALKRSGLVRVFVYEGYAYSLIASLVGTLVGLGVAAGLVWGINRASESFADLFNADLEIPLYVEPGSLVVAASAGLLITFLAVFLTSLRISNLNIVAAIRDLPESRPLRRSRLALVPQMLLLLFGLGSFVAGYLSTEALPSVTGYLLLVGPVLAAFGLGLLLGKVVPARPVWTIAGAGVLAYSYFANEVEAVARANESNPAIFFIEGVLMVLGAVLLVALNLGLLYRLLWGVMRFVPTLAPVLKIAVAHPAAHRARTGFTLAMFALILYIVTVSAIFSSTQSAASEQTREAQLSGYDGALQSGPVAPVGDFEERVEGNEVLQSSISRSARLVAGGVELPEYRAEDYTTPFGPPIGEGAPGAGISEYVTYLPGGFLQSTSDELEERSSEYPTDQEAWEALGEDPNLAILTAPYNGEGNGVARPDLGAGDTIRMRDPVSGREVEKQVIGRIKDPGGFSLQVVNGVLVGEGARGEFPGLLTQETYLFDTERGADEVAVGRELKKEFASTGAQSFLLDDILGRGQRFLDTFVGIVQAFLAFGLLVGVAGLAVISARAVHERRREIGTLRAIGFKGATVGWQFVVESSSIALIGILLGIAVGTLGGYNLFDFSIDDPEAVFVFPWTQMLLIGAGVWAASLLFTIVPAVRASRLRPVEALRYEG